VRGGCRRGCRHEHRRTGVRQAGRGPGHRGKRELHPGGAGQAARSRDEGHPAASRRPAKRDRRMMERRALVATRSRHKLEEVRTILGGSLRIHGEVHELIDLVTAGIAPRPEEEDVEAFDTLRENALAKARYFFRLTGMPTIADDSGIVVHALAGEPGVRSKRFSGRSDLSGQALDDANNALLL